MSETRLGQPVCLDCDEVYVGEGPICGRCEQGKEPESCPTCATLRAELEKVRGERDGLQTARDHYYRASANHAAMFEKVKAERDEARENVRDAARDYAVLEEAMGDEVQALMTFKRLHIKAKEERGEARAQLEALRDPAVAAEHCGAEVVEIQEGYGQTFDADSYPLREHPVLLLAKPGDGEGAGT